MSSTSLKSKLPPRLEKKLAALAAELGVQPALIVQALQKSGLLTGPSSVALPKRPPALYSERHKRQDLVGLGIVEFLRAVWKPWIDAGILTRVALRHLDPSAEQALQNFLRKSELPSDLRLPKKSELLKKELAKLPAEDVRAARRVINWVHRNERRKH